MTVNINLLSWRETRQQKKQVMIICYFGISLLILLVLQAGLYTLLSIKITMQNKRNTFLSNEIKLLEKKAEVQQTWMKNKSVLLEKAIKVHRLQAKGIEVVKLLDALPRWVPQGVYLTNFSQSHQQLLLQGKAESHEAIATFMRNINQSACLDALQLILNQNDKVQTEQVAFQLRAVDPVLHNEE